MVSMQNHLCRSGCFVFLYCDSRFCVFCLSRIWFHPCQTSTNTCISQFHVTPLEPPSFKMLFMLFYHVVALEAAAFTQILHNLHKSNLAVKRNNLRVINEHIFPPLRKTQSLCMPFSSLSKSLTHYISRWKLTNICWPAAGAMWPDQGCIISPCLIFGEFSLLPGCVASAKVLICCSFKALKRKVSNAQKTLKRQAGTDMNYQEKHNRCVQKWFRYLVEVFSNLLTGQTCTF